MLREAGEADRPIMRHSNTSTSTPELHELDSRFERLSSTRGSFSTCTSDTYAASSTSLPDLWPMTLSEQDAWVLNKSSRSGDHEKFFITFTENHGCGHWLAITCQYRNVEPNSLEEELMALPSAPARSWEIYATLRHRLPQIGFFEHVTHLKLQTIQGKLNVFVGPGTEDCRHGCRRPDTTQNTAWTCGPRYVISVGVAPR